MSKKNIIIIKIYIITIIIKIITKNYKISLSRYRYH